MHLEASSAPAPAAAAYVLTRDLMVRSSLGGVGRSAGGEIEFFDDATQLLAAVARQAPAVVAIDLQTPGLSIDELAPQIRVAGSHPLFLLAWAPHVHVASLAAARVAGVDEATPRSQLVARMTALVAPAV